MDFNVTTDAALSLKYGISFWIGRDVTSGNVGSNIGAMGAYFNADGSWHLGDVFSVPDEFARLTWDSGTLRSKVEEQARREFEMSGVIQTAYGDILNVMAAGGLAKLAAAAVDATVAKITTKIITTPKAVSVAPEMINASRVTQVTRGITTLKETDVVVGVIKNGRVLKKTAYPENPALAPSHEMLAKEAGVWVGTGELAPGIEAFTVWKESGKILIRGSNDFNPEVSELTKTMLEQLFK